MIRKQKASARREARSKQIKIMLSFPEHEKLSEMAYRSRTNVANCARTLIFKGEIREAMTLDKLSTLREIAAIGNNLNQLVRLCHKENLGNHAQSLKILIVEINRILMR